MQRCLPWRRSRRWRRQGSRGGAGNLGAEGVLVQRPIVVGNEERTAACGRRGGAGDGKTLMSLGSRSRACVGVAS